MIEDQVSNPHFSLRQGLFSILAVFIAFFGLAVSRCQAENEVLAAFLSAVERGQMEELTSMLHPKLVSQVDAPVLEAWLQAVAFRLGRVEVVSPGTLIASEDREETSAAVQFSKGTATVSLVSIQSQIVSFEVQSESMTNWFSRPTSLKIYRERVEQFIQSLLNEEDSTCLELLHPEVAEKLSPSQLGTYRSSLQTSAGQITATQFHHANLTIQEDERLSQMELIYQLTGSKRTVEASFVIRFRGMRGEIVGFQVR